MWEYEWCAQCRHDPAIQAYLKAHYPAPISAKTPNTMTEAQILEAIKGDDMFGTAEVDIIVPDELREHFSEMTPIFKNVMISRDDVRDVMATFARECEIMSQPC